jgi:glycerol-3-phosphate dehydrogenase
MGRCQGGFCGPKVIEILARELNVDPKEIRKNNSKSYMVCGKVK